MANLPKTPTPNNERTQAVVNYFRQDSHASVRNAGRQLDINPTTVWRELKKSKFHPYKKQYHQQLNDNDDIKRNQMCKALLHTRLVDPSFFQDTCFSDEAVFKLDGEVNKQNHRCWSDNNPEWFEGCHTQGAPKVTVWCGIWRGMIIGPYFIDGCLDGEGYNFLLREVVKEMIERTGEISRFFQQDGAPCHYSALARHYLDFVWTGRWIGRGSKFIEWAPRSPDIAPLDFFLWGYLKHRVYKDRPSSLEELQSKIRAECRAIESVALFDNVRENLIKRLKLCISVEGEHFEHLIRKKS